MGDSALYTEKNITALGRQTKWISCVPATIKEMTVLLKSDLIFSPTSDPRYSCYATNNQYGNITQKWIVVKSEEMKIRETKTFEKNFSARFKTHVKDLKTLSAVPYACEADAKNAFSRYLMDNSFVIPFHSNITTAHKRANGKRGRPKDGEALITCYQIKATIELDPIQVEKEREYLGRFVLATNALELDPETILHHYKGQMLVEKGFRFLKDKSFKVAEVYLKSEKRIEALCMVMVLCLMIYSYTEWLMRKRLQEEKETVLDQKKRPTAKPTMKWIYFKFREIKSYTVRMKNTIQSSVHNINNEILKILVLLGPEYEKFYV